MSILIYFNKILSYDDDYLINKKFPLFSFFKFFLLLTYHKCWLKNASQNFQIIFLFSSS